MEALKAKAAQAEAAANLTVMSEVTDAEITYTANATTSTSGQTIKVATGTGPKKKAGKPNDRYIENVLDILLTQAPKEKSREK